MSSDFKAKQSAQHVADTAAMLDGIKERLLSEITDKRRDLQALSGNPDAGDDFETLARTDAVATVESAEIERDMQELREVEQALARLETGRYGLCEQCQEKIAAERLAVRPTTRYCVTCQGAYETGSSE